MNRRAFTLIELVMAMAGCAVILTAIYGVFSRAIKLRDSATERTREARVRAHALAVLRNDLSNGRVAAGGVLASVLSGAQTSRTGGFPGELKFTTTTAPDDQDLPAGDVHQVEYYITADPNAPGQRSAGLLVRTVQHDLLETVQGTPAEEPLLAGVEAMELAFYDGTDWQDSWEYDATDNPTVPKAVRVRLQLSPPGGSASATTLELVVPWTAQLAPP